MTPTPTMKRDTMRVRTNRPVESVVKSLYAVFVVPFVVLSMVFVSAPALADSVRVVDHHDDWTAPSDQNITGMRLSNSTKVVRARVDLERVRRSTGTVFVTFQMVDEPGWIFEVTSRLKKGGQKRNRVFAWPNTVDRNPVDCPGLKVRWRTGKGGAVIFKLPQRCIFGPRAYGEFSARVLPRRMQEFMDWLDWPGTLEVS